MATFLSEAGIGKEHKERTAPGYSYLGATLTPKYARPPLLLLRALPGKGRKSKAPGTYTIRGYMDIIENMLAFLGMNDVLSRTERAHRIPQTYAMP